MPQIWEIVEINPEKATKEFSLLEATIEKISDSTLKEGTDIITEYLKDMSRERAFAILFILNRDFSRCLLEKKMIEELMFRLSNGRVVGNA